MATVVLIHGMWHGAWCWKEVTPLLHTAGHEVHTVSLTGVGERAHLHYPDIDLHTHIQDVVALLEYEDLHNVILVGHSLAGFMTRGVAERVPDRVAQIISLDGRIPENGDPFKTMWPDIWTELYERAHADGCGATGVFSQRILLQFDICPQFRWLDVFDADASGAERRAMALARVNSWVVRPSAQARV